MPWPGRRSSRSRRPRTWRPGPPRRAARGPGAERRRRSPRRWPCRRRQRCRPSQAPARGSRWRSRGRCAQTAPAAAVCPCSREPPPRLLIRKWRQPAQESTAMRPRRRGGCRCRSAGRPAGRPTSQPRRTPGSSPPMSSSQPGRLWSCRCQRCSCRATGATSLACRRSAPRASRGQTSPPAAARRRQRSPASPEHSSRAAAMAADGPRRGQLAGARA
mmetsp:Transcript_97812/g.259855  ORF Transcript_97812/g.259855 Transcript_97812/m.259855 type:complete len:217 (+) Transcript_97812:390-1040(+)